MWTMLWVNSEQRRWVLLSPAFLYNEVCVCVCVCVCVVRVEGRWPLRCLGTMMNETVRVEVWDLTVDFFTTQQLYSHILYTAPAWICTYGSCFLSATLSFTAYIILFFCHLFSLGVCIIWTFLDSDASMVHTSQIHQFLMFKHTHL